MLRRFFVAAGAFALLAACAKKKRPSSAGAPRAKRSSPAVKPGWKEEGIASWYGDPYHGRRAANGEVYDMEKLTAAHRTLPFETWVRVENLANGKEVNVRITDRGPFIDRRIIDLSRAAARKIDLLGPGTARVRIEVIRAPESEAASEGGFAVQVGAFREKRRAEETARRMRGQHGESRLVEREGQGTVYRVLVGRFPERLGAEELAARLRPEFPSAFVVRCDD